MAFDPEQVGDFLPEEHLAVAIAMADRAARDQIIMDSMRAQIVGVPAVERPPEEVRATHLGRATLLLLQVEDPSRLLTIQELATAGSSDAADERQAESIRMRMPVSNDPEDIVPRLMEAADVKDIRSAVLDELQSSTDVNETLTQDFARQLAASKCVAAEHGVMLETVYADDVLYYEAYRSAFTVQEEVDKASMIIATLSGDMITKLALQVLDRFLPPEIRDQMPPDELEMRRLEIELNPEIQAVIAAQAELVQEPLKQHFLYDLIKTYGYEAVSQLSPAQIGSLLPKMRITTELAELIPSIS